MLPTFQVILLASIIDEHGALALQREDFRKQAVRRQAVDQVGTFYAADQGTDHALDFRNHAGLHFTLLDQLFG